MMRGKPLVSVPPPWTPEGGEVSRWLPPAPFQFTATRSVAVLAPDSYEEIGVLEEGTTCRAVEVSGPWVLAEDRSGHRGWVPLGVLPVWRPGASALGAVIHSVFATVAVAFTAWWAAVEYTGCFLTCDPRNRNLLGGVLLTLLAAVVLVGGMVVARRAGTGGRGRPSLLEAAALVMVPAAAGILHWAAWANLWVVGWVAVGVLVIGSWFVWRAAARSRGRPPR
jgi:hypothetical protein